MTFQPPSGRAWTRFESLLRSHEDTRSPVPAHVLREVAAAVYIQGYRDGESVCHCTDCWLERHQQREAAKAAGT